MGDISKDQDLAIDFRELSNDEPFKERVNSLQNSLHAVQILVDQMISLEMYDKLEPADQVRYDLFLAFTINSLYWVYMRTHGKDPNQSDLKNELQRVKEYMSKSKKLYEKKHIMPRLDKGAAERFVRSGLWDPDDPNRKAPNDPTDAPEEGTSVTTHGKRKRDESESE